MVLCSDKCGVVKTDKCISETLLKTGIGGIFGLIGSILLRRQGPFIFGIGFGMGIGIANCKNDYQQYFPLSYAKLKKITVTPPPPPSSIPKEVKSMDIVTENSKIPTIKPEFEPEKNPIENNIIQSENTEAGATESKKPERECVKKKCYKLFQKKSCDHK